MNTRQYLKDWAEQAGLELFYPYSSRQKVNGWAEKLARKNKLHLIYLKTRVGWKAIAFYESLGYREVFGRG